MKILLISDLHLKEKNNDEINKITDDMIRCVKNKMKKNDEIIVITLGDIIDCGKPVAFKQAQLFYSRLKENFKCSEFRFVPGNHELENSNLDAFNLFIKYFGQPAYTDDATVQTKTVEGFRIIYVDSTLSRDFRKAGQINIEEIKEKIKNKRSSSRNIICMHFPPSPQQGIDKNIPNSDKLIATRTNYIFYGHQHGYLEIPDFLEGDTDIHSVGALLKDGVKEHEFILLDIAGGKINYAYRYKHAGVSFTPEILLPSKFNLQSDKIRVAVPSSQSASPLKRKIMPVHEDINNSRYGGLLWSIFQGTDIDEYFKANNLIILQGDAGSGKSFELQRIYETYKDDDEYFPIWVQLKNVSNEKLNEYIDYCKNTIDRKTPLLIFDGLDEMASQNSMDFIRNISSAVVGDIEIKVIISVRTALIRHIGGFVQCTLIDINDTEIKEYSESKSVNVELFHEELYKSGCLELARKPFYLVEMVKLFANTNTLPKEIDLMQIMINNRFYDSDEKNSQTLQAEQGLLENEALLHNVLREISFFMEIQKEYALTNYHYTYIWDINVRNLLKRTGLLTKQTIGNTVFWEFEHNNFREYLAAKYLNQLSFDEIISIIAYDENTSKLRPSWLNVVAYLLSMQNEDKLTNWLIDNAKDALCDFESDKLTLESRNEIFKDLMNDANKKQLPLDNVNKLGRYFQSDDTIGFMLAILKTSTNNYAVQNTLRVLCHCNNFFDKENELKTVIIEKLLKNTNPDYIVSLSVKALMQIFSNNLVDITAEIFTILEEDGRIRVFGTLCELIVKAKTVDNYIDNIIEILKSDKDMTEYLDVTLKIESVFNNVKSFSGVSSAINFFSDP